VDGDSVEGDGDGDGVEWDGDDDDIERDGDDNCNGDDVEKGMAKKECGFAKT
jgi:hypothetical protein